MPQQHRRYAQLSIMVHLFLLLAILLILTGCGTASPVTVIVTVEVTSTQTPIPTPSPTPTITPRPAPVRQVPGQFESSYMHDTYKIYAKVPGNYDPAQPLPVIYILDADWYFYGGVKLEGSLGLVQVAEQLRISKQMPAAILVGVGYSGENQRRRDLVDSAANFYNFLKNELIPVVESTYATTDERVLIGHSNGGGFVIYALSQYERNPGDSPFMGFVALSGDYSGRYGDYHAMEDGLFERLGNTIPLDARLYLGVGREEEERFVESNDTLAQQIRGRDYTGFLFRYQKYAGEDHGSVVEPGIRDGLRWVFQDG